MRRITSNNTREMDMHQLALNQVRIENGWAWYRGGVPEHDQSVCDLIRAAAETLMVELPMLSDDALSDLMTDWLQYGEEEPEGILAILYRALCAAAELRDKLSRYEDTGLEPEEITIEKPACVFYCNRQCNLNGDFCAEGPGCPFELDGAKAWKFLLQTTQPNTPLTLEELREMDGEPVYIKSVFGRMYAIVEVSYGRVYLHAVNSRKMCPYEFLAWEKAGGFKVYRRKPEEGTR